MCVLQNSDDVWIWKNWTCSPERIDVTMGYMKNNVCFICREFNTVDSTNKAVGEVSGSSLWSKAKVEYIKNLVFLQNLDDIIEDLRRLF